MKKLKPSFDGNKSRSSNLLETLSYTITYLTQIEQG